MDERLPSAPTGLGVKGKRLWRDMVADFTVNAAELRLLEALCRTVDTISELESLVAEEGPVVATPTGSTRTNPALVELRHQRGALKGLVAALSLPADEDSPRQTPRQRRAHKAARARWDRSA